MDTWKYDIRTWYPKEATTFLGNGFVGGAIPIDGHGLGGNGYAATLAAFFVGADENAPPIPHWLNVPLRIDGKAPDVSWVRFRQTLDLRQGLMRTSYFDKSHSIQVTTETFCHRDKKNLAAYRITVEGFRDVQLELSPCLDAANCAWAPETIDIADGDSMGWTLGWGDSNRRVGQSLHLKLSHNGDSVILREDKKIGRRYTLHLTTGKRCTLEGVVATCAGSDPVIDARKALSSSLDFDTLLSTNAAAMEQVWGEFGVRLGDPFLERRANACMFYLLASYREDIVFGGGPGGLSSSGGWGGCVFWDSEFYILPGLMPFFPKLARNILAYRFETLDGARANAKAHGETGARFAWQSKRSGKPFGGEFEEERHISSDIAYSAWWYAKANADSTFWDEKGRIMLCEVARNWASRVVWNESGNRYEIHNVIPPDEHVQDHHTGRPINNSVMTNAYAKWVLEQAAAITTGTTADERQQWSRIAEGMYLPHDQANDIYAEYDGYDGHPIKQADVAHLFFPLRSADDAETIRRNCYYYADRERETGLYLTLSPPVYAAALSRAGDVSGVARFLALSHRNFSGPFEIPRESNYATAPIMTGAGSFLSLLIYAVLGLETMDDTLHAHPCVPEEIGFIEVTGIHFRGRQFSASAKDAGQAVIRQQS